MIYKLAVLDAVITLIYNRLVGACDRPPVVATITLSPCCTIKPLPVEVALAMVAAVVLAVPKFTTASMLALLVLSIRKYCVL